MRLRNPLLSVQREREARFLTECLFVCEADRPKLREYANRGLRWDRIARLAVTSAVPGPVYRSIVESGLQAQVPADALQQIEDAYRSNTALNAMMLRELADVSGALDAVGIPSIALKGSALMLTRFSSLGSRVTADVDLLVPPRRAEDAGRVLEARGYTPKPDPEGKVREPVRGHHLPAYVHKRGFCIELHRWIVGPAPRAEEEWRALHSRARELAAFGGRLRIPSDGDLFSIACIHIMEGHRGELPYLARHLVDLQALLASGSVDVASELGLFPGHEAAILESLGMLVSCGRGVGLPSRPPRYSPVELFSPSLGLRDLHEVAVRARNIGKHPYGAWRGIFPSARWMHSLYGPGWLPRLYARRFAEKLIPDSLRRW